MKTYKEMTFDELLKYKARLIDDGVWSGISIEKKNEIGEELEEKGSVKYANFGNIRTAVKYDS